MPAKLSSPSKHGKSLEMTYARRISTVNKKDNKFSGSSSLSDGAKQRNAQRRYRSIKISGHPPPRILTKQHEMQENFRAAGYTQEELSSFVKNYTDASNYHYDKARKYDDSVKGDSYVTESMVQTNLTQLYAKGEHYGLMADAAKTELTTMKRVATTAKNKTELAAKMKRATDKRLAKQKSTKAKTTKAKTTTTKT